MEGSMITYISPTVSDDGWLVGLDEHGTRIDFVAYLKVDAQREEGGRTYLVVQEGPTKGTKGSVLTAVDSRASLVERVTQDPQGLVFVDFDRRNVVVRQNRLGHSFELMEGRLWLGGKPTPDPKYAGHNAIDALKYSVELVSKHLQEAPARVVTLKDEPPAKGWHALEIPDFSHAGGISYKTSSMYATTWFRVGHEGEAYLHAGRISKGCITVEPEDWTRVYRYLIARRKDIQSVGAILVSFVG
jgi:hypothetical protein